MTQLPTTREQVVKNLRKNDTYVLYHCGMKAPAMEELPEEVRQIENFNNFFAVPLNRVSVLDTSAYGFMVRGFEGEDIITDCKVQASLCIPVRLTKQHDMQASLCMTKQQDCYAPSLQHASALVAVLGHNAPGSIDTLAPFTTRRKSWA